MPKQYYEAESSTKSLDLNAYFVVDYLKYQKKYIKKFSNRNNKTTKKQTKKVVQLIQADSERTPAPKEFFSVIIIYLQDYFTCDSELFEEVYYELIVNI